MKFVGPWTVHNVLFETGKSTFAVTVHWTVTAFCQNAKEKKKKKKKKEKRKTQTQNAVSKQRLNVILHLSFWIFSSNHHLWTTFLCFIFCKLCVKSFAVQLVDTSLFPSLYFSIPNKIKRKEIKIFSIFLLFHPLTIFYPHFFTLPIK